MLTSFVSILFLQGGESDRKCEGGKPLFPKKLYVAAEKVGFALNNPLTLVDKDGMMRNMETKERIPTLCVFADGSGTMTTHSLATDVRHNEPVMAKIRAHAAGFICPVFYLVRAGAIAVVGLDEGKTVAKAVPGDVLVAYGVRNTVGHSVPEGGR